MTKEFALAFRADKGLVSRMESLSKELKLDRSKLVTLAIDELFQKYITPGLKGQLMVVVTQQFDRLTMAFQARIAELDPEMKAQAKAAKEAELGKKIHRLYAQDRKKEAEQLAEESYKKGLVPWFFQWEKE